MSKAFTIKTISLIGKSKDLSRDIHFAQGVNVIVGPTGTGKTSLVELIKFTLGGRGTVTDAVQRGLLGTSLALEIGGASFHFARQIRKKVVEVRQGKGGRLIGVYPMKASSTGERSISDFLLEILEIPSIRITKSRTRPGKESVRLSFFDIYRYLYLPQSEIDRSVIRHLDSSLDPKRRAAFRLLYGLTNETVSQMEVEFGKAKDELKEKRRQLNEIKAYLRRVGPTEQDLMLEREVIRNELSDLRSEEEAIRKGLAQATDSERYSREELRALYSEVREVSRVSVEARSNISDKKNLVAQLELDKKRLKKTIVSSDGLGGIDFKVCPSCLQNLEASRVQAGECAVCLQDLPVEEVEPSIERQLIRLDRQIGETLRLLDDETRAHKSTQERTRRLKDRIGQIEKDLESKLGQYVSPKLEVVSDLARQSAEKKSRIRFIEEALRYWQECSEMQEAIERLAGDKVRLAQEITAERLQLNEAKDRIKELSETFQDVLSDYEQPWFRQGEIDTDSYLPIVNTLPFEKLTAGSGGVPTLVNGAYHIAGLLFSIRNSHALLPPLLIVDSPRKNLGVKKEDKETNSKIYDHYRMLSASYPEGFQLIVVDNDVPTGFAAFVKLRLSYEAPLIPGIDHPGEGRVAPIGEDQENAATGENQGDEGQLGLSLGSTRAT